jgi:hypothetical protein
MNQRLVVGRGHATDGSTGFILLAGTLVMTDYPAVIGWFDRDFGRGLVGKVIHGGGSLTYLCEWRRRHGAGSRRQDRLRNVRRVGPMESCTPCAGSQAGRRRIGRGPWRSISGARFQTWQVGVSWLRETVLGRIVSEGEK